MNISILFWFYKRLDICKDRLKTLRLYNPNVKIFGLYGGSISNINEVKSIMVPFLDDLYIFNKNKDSIWKWKNGDKLIASWYKDRGSQLDWETIFVVQWDMLVLAPLSQLFNMLKPGQILLSGFRPLEEVKEDWIWTDGSNYDNKLEFDSFIEDLSKKYDYFGPQFACLFIIVCLPRLFLEKYIDKKTPDIGFLEYKIPTMAKVFGIPICNEHPYNPSWSTRPKLNQEKILNAVGVEVPLSVILNEYSKPLGLKIFHPVRKHVPMWMLNPRISKLMSSIIKIVELPRTIMKYFSKE